MSTNDETKFLEFYNRRIDDVLAIVNALSIVCQLREFRQWLNNSFKLQDDSDILPGYLFAFDILTRRLHDSVSRNISLGLKQDSTFSRADFSDKTLIYTLPNTCEKVIFLKRIRSVVDPVLSSNSWVEAEEKINIFYKIIIEPLLKLKEISNLNPTYTIPSVDEAITYITMNEIFIYLNDTERGIPHGYPTPMLDSSLWHTSQTILSPALSRAFEGYKYTVQFIWSNLLQEQYFGTSIVNLYRAKNWQAFDSFFNIIQNEVIDPLEQKIRVNLGLAPILVITGEPKKITITLLQKKSQPYSLNKLEKLEQIFLWYNIELIDASQYSMFNGVPSLISIIAGSVEIKRRQEIQEKIKVIKLIHPAGNNRNTYSYAVLMEMYWTLSDASGWLLFFSCCYDFTGTGLAQSKRVDDFIKEYEEKELISMSQIRVKESEFLDLMKPYILKSTKHQDIDFPKSDNLLREIRRAEDTREILHETADRFGTSRGMLLELLTYYIYSSPGIKIDWNFTHNKIQIDVLLRNENEIRFFECKKPNTNLISEAKEFKEKVQLLLDDANFKKDWNITNTLSINLTLIIWQRPEEEVLQQIKKENISIEIVSDQLTKNRKLLGKQKDKIKHVFSDVPKRVNYSED